MTSIGSLYTSPNYYKGKYAKAVAAWAGLTLDLPEYTHYTDNLKPEFIAKFSSGKIPAFEDKEGFTLFEGAVIARYIAELAPNSGLLGNGPKDAALVNQWVHFAEDEVANPTQNLALLFSGKLTPYSKPLQNFFTERLERGLKTLEQHLASRTFFVGERITLADIVVSLLISRVSSVYLDASARPKFPNLVRHFETLVNQPKLKEAYGDAKLAEKAEQYTPPAKEKKEKPAPALAAPKTEKKKKEAEAEDDDDEPAVPAEPKVKNPLDDLPKSTFNLEDWKRAYSNKDTRGPGGALEWFYQNYDPAGFSIWRVDFKYNEELTQTFMSSNQIGGFFNRLEASRKYLFGSMGVLGETNNSVISGALILRGPDCKPVVEVAPDWESYEFKKLDLANEEDKKFFEAALAWDLEIDGKKWVDGKNFK